MRRAPDKPGARLPCAILLAAAALLLVACGGSSSTGDAASSARSAGAAPAGGTQSAPSRARTTAKARPDTVTNGVVVHRPAPGTGGNEINDDNPGVADTGKGAAPGQLDPCTLVSRAQARAIVGHPVDAPQEEPLGPTCIYRRQGAKSFVTVTVESIDFSTVKPQIRGRTSTEVAGHTVYCGDYGQPTTFVPLSGGRVLSVMAPCAVGTRFAATALGRLHD